MKASTGYALAACLTMVLGGAMTLVSLIFQLATTGDHTYERMQMALLLTKISNVLLVCTLILLMIGFARHRSE